MSTSTAIGKQRRMARIFDPKTDRTVIAPLDDSLLAGPEGGLRDLKGKIRQVTDGGANAILGFYGLFARNIDLIHDRGCIMNITASTIRGTHTRKTLVGSVQQALEMDMDAVAVHVNIGSAYEPEMLRILGNTAQECQRSGMPLLALMYPRTEKGKGQDDNYYDLLRTGPEAYAEVVRHAVRIGAELGADIIKTPYTGTPESFATVVDSSLGVPVVIAGGPEMTIEHIMSVTHGAVSAGAAGIAGGRNGFHRRDSQALIKALRLIVHENAGVESALEYFRDQRPAIPEADILENDLPGGTTRATETRNYWIDDAANSSGRISKQ